MMFFYRTLKTRRLAAERSPIPRKGLVLLEVVVAAGLVIVLMSVAVPLVVQTARIWKQTQHYQFAADELSGQMDRLIALPASQRGTEMEQLEISPQTRRVLGKATLSGKTVVDGAGKRIELSIDWPRVGPAEPVRLVAWVDPMPDSATTEAEPTLDSGEELP